jgi:mRNA interferase MazF
LIRLRIDVTGTNGLNETSSLMVDKIRTVPRTRLGARMGFLGDEDMLRFGRAALVFLGIAGGKSER